MTAAKDFTIHYIGPSIVRCGPRDFCLEYREPGLDLSMPGLEDRLGDEGHVLFPTPEQWAASYPELIDQRDRVKANIIAWTKELPSMRGFIARFLSDERKIAAVAAEAEAERLEGEKRAAAHAAEEAEEAEEGRMSPMAMADWLFSQKQP